MLAGKGGKNVHHHPCDMGIRSLIQFYQINIGGAGVEITFSLTGTQLGKRLRGGGIFPKKVNSAKGDDVDKARSRRNFFWVLITYFPGIQGFRFFMYKFED